MFAYIGVPKVSTGLAPNSELRYGPIEKTGPRGSGHVDSGIGFLKTSYFTVGFLTHPVLNIYYYIPSGHHYQAQGQDNSLGF